jgi:hypothetical protein
MDEQCIVLSAPPMLVLSDAPPLTVTRMPAPASDATITTPLMTTPVKQKKQRVFSEPLPQSMFQSISKGKGVELSRYSGDSAEAEARSYSGDHLQHLSGDVSRFNDDHSAMSPFATRELARDPSALALDWEVLHHVVSECFGESVLKEQVSHRNSHYGVYHYWYTTTAASVGLAFGTTPLSCCVNFCVFFCINFFVCF